MAYLFESETRKKANEFIKYLEEAGFQTEFPGDAFKNYNVRIGISALGEYLGKITIYFKPTKNTYTLQVNELKPSIRDVIMQIWDYTGLNGDSITYTNSGIEIDVDGSYKDGKTSYAAIIRKDGDVIKHLVGLLGNEDVQGTYQVAGELQAATEAIKYCDENNISEAVIYYDMAGIESWATGRWKANKEVTKKFQEFVKLAKVKIKWVKVKSHTGLKWNEAVDKLASSMFY
jgi:ribonuclease HI